MTRDDDPSKDAAVIALQHSDLNILIVNLPSQLVPESHTNKFNNSRTAAVCLTIITRPIFRLSNLLWPNVPFSSFVDQLAIWHDANSMTHPISDW